MGTRHLIAVQLDGEYKIAQYGQWDGYPSGQGLLVLAFLQAHDHTRFKEQCRRLRWLRDDEIPVINANKNWFNEYPWLSRDAGADILRYVYDMDQEFALVNRITFAQEGLFCEYAYVIDFDKNVLEVYDGFHKEDVVEGRFAGQRTSGTANEYGPVQLMKSYPLDALPDEATFLVDLEGSDEGKEEAAA